MQLPAGIYLGDRTTIVAANGLSTGSTRDMHLRNATLCYNRDKKGYAMLGSIKDDAKVMDLETAVEYIIKLAKLLDA